MIESDDRLIELSKILYFNFLSNKIYDFLKIF